MLTLKWTWHAETSGCVAELHNCVQTSVTTLGWICRSEQHTRIIPGSLNEVEVELSEYGTQMNSE